MYGLCVLYNYWFRPNDFLPVEYAGIRGIEQRLYKEQEKIKSKHQSDVQKFYIKYCCSLPTNGTIMFPVREPRRKIFQSTKLRPVLLGINEKGIMRVCPKSKEVLDFWEYQVLKNWAYSRRTFVIVSHTPLTTPINISTHQGI
jgi:hypothetical protein